jgi:hypothetical protein
MYQLYYKKEESSEVCKVSLLSLRLHFISNNDENPLFTSQKKGTDNDLPKILDNDAIHFNSTQFVNKFSSFLATGDIICSIIFYLY